MGSTEQLFLLPGAKRRDPAVDKWFADRPGELGETARLWFDVMRACGDDVRGILHDGHPTACVGEAAFAYVNAFTKQVNVGFFRGAELPDAAGLLQGTGKRMRHVKLGAEHRADADALAELIRAAYMDMKRRVEADQSRSVE